ncbi:hypothetical protein EIP86_001964 [Pleurotus ostreatoroseus]|nr:hypothetical protein EIP86_001964 [Pleurotus ostreatoroseus]
MPARKNPLQMSTIVGTIKGVVDHARQGVHERAHEWAAAQGVEVKYVDINVHFIGASGIPKMDVVGTADPYFVAKLDNKLSFTCVFTFSEYYVNIHASWLQINRATQHACSVMDKDVGQLTDDYVGTFNTTVSPGAKEFNLEGSSFRRNRGVFWLEIQSSPATDDQPASRPYMFDGPIRFTRHFSPTVGRLTNINDERLYSTWKMYLRRVRLYFGDTVQHWNRDYRAAQTIFQGPTSLAVRSTIQAGHAMLYARSTTNGFGVVDTPRDVLAILHGGQAGSPHAHRVKPAVYTYVIAVDDDSFRFSETGAAFFVDFASKHALHANCAQAVRYSGEFHPRPAGGWENFSDETPDDQVRWELVIDNNSGTYAPDKAMLPTLKSLLEFNFPGFTIQALDREDPELTQSREACRAYALSKRGVRQDELQPHTHGERPLSQEAADNITNPLPTTSVNGIPSVLT